MIEIVILDDKQELTRDEFSSLLKHVSLEKQKRIKQFRFMRDAQNSLLGDLMARMEICRSTGLANEQLRFALSAYGKPYLSNISQIHFNISHAGRHVVCAVSDEPIGIDVETIKPIDMRISDRFFTVTEIDYINSSDSLTSFYEIWTKKESYIKWKGKGLSIPLNSFSVFELVSRDHVFYYEVFSFCDSICYVCTNKQEKLKINYVDYLELIDFFNPNY